MHSEIMSTFNLKTKIISQEVQLKISITNEQDITVKYCVGGRCYTKIVIAKSFTVYCESQHRRREEKVNKSRHCIHKTTCYKNVLEVKELSVLLCKQFLPVWPRATRSLQVYVGKTIKILHH